MRKSDIGSNDLCTQTAFGSIRSTGKERVLEALNDFYIYGNSRGGIMEKNAGTIDRVVRVVIGIILLYAVATGMVHGILMYVAGILGIMMLVTAALAYCPLYPVFRSIK